MPNLHVVERGSGETIVFVHGGFSTGLACWREQLPLADRFRVVIIDRGGYGRSPAGPRRGFEDDAQALGDLIEGGAHLVGLSYGALGCLRAAAQSPDAVRSLTLVEPATFCLARGEAAVEQLLARIRAVTGRAASLAPGEFYAEVLESAGIEGVPREGYADEELETFRATMLERPMWEAELDPEAIAAAGVPALVVTGSWESRPAAAQELGAAAFRVAADTISARLGARSVHFVGSAHNPQLTEGPRFNSMLADFVAASGPR